MSNEAEKIVSFNLKPSPYKRLSEIAVSDVQEYLRLGETTESELSLLGTILEAAKAHVLTYTGRTAEQADLMPDLTIAVYVLCEDMFDKRTFTMDQTSSNKVIESILGSRSINLL